jgi:Protein of unknown function (DUF2878)
MATNVASTGMVEMTTAVHRPLPWYPLVHLGAYQITWFAAIMGGAAMAVWPGLLAGGLMLALHLAVSQHRVVTLNRLAQATLIGVVVDTALTASGMVSFTGCACLTPPLWMVILWPCFASLFDDLLRWVPSRPAIAVVLGGLGGPLAYVGGDALGALAFPSGNVVGLLAVGVAWAIATGLLVLVWRVRPSTKENP